MGTGIIAQAIVLILGYLTFGVLHLFEKLGVNMANVDEILASWTNWSQDLKAQLQSALDTIQQIKDTDAAEDAAQAEALTNELTAKVQAAYDSVSAPPAPPVEEPPVEQPPVEEPPVEQPSTEEPAPAEEPVPAEEAPVEGDAPAEEGSA